MPTVTTFAEFFGSVVSSCRIVQPPSISCNEPSSCGAAVCGTDNSVAGRIRLAIWPKVTGGTRVEWELPADMYVATNTTYQLQFSRSPAQDEWEDVGPTLVNSFSAIDYEYRDIGQLRHSYYRIAINTGTDIFVSGAFYSDVAGFNRSHMRMYNEIVRREERRYHDPQSPASKGYLLKLRRYGTVCQTCVDKDTNTRLNEFCPDCYGTGVTNGFYRPLDCFYVDVGNSVVDHQVSPEQGMFTDGELANLRFLNIPRVDPGDIWVCGSTDYRWKIGKITSITKVNQLSIVCSAVAAKLPLNHIAYSIPLTEF